MFLSLLAETCLLADRNSNGLSLRERLGHLVICFPFLFNAIPEDVITYISFYLL